MRNLHDIPVEKPIRRIIDQSILNGTSGTFTNTINFTINTINFTNELQNLRIAMDRNVQTNERLARVITTEI